MVSCLAAAAAVVRRGMRAPAAAVSEVFLTVSAPPAVYAYTPTHTHTHEQTINTLLTSKN